MSTNATQPYSGKGNQQSGSLYPVFPLSLFMLTGGMQRLRIFEQRYLSMVANEANTGGFIIALYKKDKPFSCADWGVHVNIVDFSNGDDGILIIDVIAERLVSLSGLCYDEKGLLFAQAENFPHWSTAPVSSQPPDTKPAELASFLKQVFNDNPELKQLYQQCYFEEPSWVSARLLEIIPIPVDEKEKFIHHLGLTQLNQLLFHLCTNSIEH